MKQLQTLTVGLLNLALLGVLCVFLASPGQADQPYDLIFKTGTLDGISRNSVLAYQRTTVAPQNQELADTSTGTINLSFAENDMAHLEFLQKEKHRKIGEFPANVGNPMIMYFVETVVRDMAGTAGGSPFYIRNRVKASLIEDAPVEDVEVEYQGKQVQAKSVTLSPFRDDPNRAKMRGFENLALTITMSDQIPGWYHSLKAGTGNDVYSNEIVLQPFEGTK
ncbi:hypothetical protein [Roseibium sediminis]|uniref:hypothetical protein n=1 Tax=Roseibium sediminis TaxID=1775174 RepID=UPI001AD8A751|nr:hypothetical protein [Roseibium sediminis]